MLRRLAALLARSFAPARQPSPALPDDPDEAAPSASRPTSDSTSDSGSDSTSDSRSDDVAVLPIEDSIDLHGFLPRDIPSVVEEYLAEAHAKGFVEVRLIHGRGKGVQRAVVQSLLARHPLVASFCDAPSSRGGWGATVVWLKRDP